VHDGAQKINGYARAALASCIDVVTWLSPDDGALTTAGEGMRECLALVATSFTFRGFALRSEVGDVPGQIQRAAFRNVVTGALVHLSDEQAPPAEILIGAQAGADGLEMTLTARGLQGEPGFATAPIYRPLTRADLDALARADSVQLRREGSSLSLLLPWVNA
jgi:hypothetical protein